MGRFTAYTLAVVAVLLLAAAASLYVGINLKPITPLLERQLGTLLQRELRIGEAPTLRVRKTLTLTAGAIVVGNPDASSDAGRNDKTWAGSGPLLQARSLRLEVVTRSLLFGPIIIADLQLRDVALDIEVDARGRSNLPDTQTADAADESGVASTADGLPLILDQADIKGLTLRHRDARSARDIQFSVDELTQSSAGGQALTLRAKGSLQQRPWQLQLEGSPLQSLIDGQNIHATFDATLGDLQLNGDFALPDASRPGDLSMNAVLDGSVPQKIAELSPILDSDQPMRATLVVTDVDPGIDLDLQVDFTAIDVSIQGRVEQPLSGNGIDLNVSLDAASLPRLASALGLGATDEVPLTLNATVARRDTRISIQDIDLRAGEHRVSGRVLLPTYPGTDDADLSLLAQGPDVGLYQRLLNRPVSLAAPYRLKVAVTAGDADAEAVDIKGTLGDINAEITGKLNDFPSYRGSSLTVSARGDSLESLGQLLETQLPTVPFRLDGTASVSAGGMLQIHSLEAEALGVTAILEGEMRTHPQLDRLDATLSLDAPSLAQSAASLGLSALPGDVPARLGVSATGALDDFALTGLKIRAGGLSATSEEGALRIAEGRLSSDLRIAVAAQDLPALLGDFAPATMPDDAVRFELLPRFDDDRAQLQLTAINGMGLQGEADVQLSRDLRIDENSFIALDLRVARPADLLPPVASYHPPAQAISLTARSETPKNGQPLSVQATLYSQDTELLTASIQFDDDMALDTLTVTGSGEDLHVFGRVDGTPESSLPFTIDAQLKQQDTELMLTLNRLEVADSAVNGELAYQPDTRLLSGDLVVPRADLALWLNAAPESNKPGSPAQPTDGRLIPDTPLPLALLDNINSDLNVRTGPLGLRDPIFREQSLIDEAELHLGNDERTAKLELKTLSGSRGDMRGQLQLRRSDDIASMDLDLQVTGFPLSLTAQGNTLASLPKHAIDLNLLGEGSTLRELAATLTGEIYVTGGPGTVRNTGMSLATESFVAQVFETLLPMLKSSDPDMAIECTVLAMQATDGVLALDPGFVLRSQRVDLSARGEINLRNEKLAVRFDNQARQGLGISAASLVNPYVQITGTLAKPSLGIDVTSSAIAGGAAVASGGLTVLAKPLYGRFLKRSNPCEVARDRWRDLGN